MRHEASWARTNSKCWDAHAWHCTVFTAGHQSLCIPSPSCSTGYEVFQIAVSATYGLADFRAVRRGGEGGREGSLEGRQEGRGGEESRSL